MSRNRESNSVVLVIREEQALYVTTETGRGSLSSSAVEKLTSWTAKVYAIAGGMAEVFLIGATNFGEHVQYRLRPLVPVFDMTASSIEGGYTRRCAADLPDMQPHDVEKPKSLWELAGLIPGKEESSKKMEQAPREEKPQP